MPITKKILLITLLLVLPFLFSSCIKKPGSQGGLISKLGKKDYYILYGKTNNTVSSHSTTGQECKSFGMDDFAGAGMVKPDGSQNQDLKIEGFPTGYPRSKQNDYYYYLSAPTSPIGQPWGFNMFDWDFDEQTIWQSDFKTGKATAIKFSSANKFPSVVISSPENKYLTYTMTKKKTEKFMGVFLDPFLSDSDLVIRNNETGQEKVVLKGNYNRMLFYSLSHFSEKEDALYTIKKTTSGFKFVKIMLDSGEVIDFEQAFSDFDWSQINWNDFFVNKEGQLQSTAYANPARFYMSPDETRLLVSRSDMGFSLDVCVNTATHELWSINLEENTIDLYSEGPSWLGNAGWKKDSQEFAFVLITAGGCYPDYMDSIILKMDREGKNKEQLASEEKSKINSVSWSPDGKEIVYDIYNQEFISSLKAVNPKTKKVREIISTQETEGTIDKQKPVTLFFVDWVASK